MATRVLLTAAGQKHKVSPHSLTLAASGTNAPSLQPQIPSQDGIEMKTAAESESLLLFCRKNMKTVIVLVAFSFLSAVSCHHQCLHGQYHKETPGPEPNMQECRLYSKSSCCHTNITEKLSASPLIHVNNYYWNRCGNLSKTCEDYMKKIECFYQCSPDVQHWMHPNSSAAIQGVPLCQSFCDGWFQACRSDQVCVRNILTDWRMDEDGNHCRNVCIPYDQMYMNSTDLCQSIAGGSFVVSASPCRCLDMTTTDKKVIKYILKPKHSEESEEEEACKPRQQQAPGKKKPDRPTRRE